MGTFGLWGSRHSFAFAASTGGPICRGNSIFPVKYGSPLPTDRTFPDAHGPDRGQDFAHSLALDGLGVMGTLPRVPITSSVSRIDMIGQ